jgi:hypothetical protein
MVWSERTSVGICPGILKYDFHGSSTAKTPRRLHIHIIHPCTRSFPIITKNPLLPSLTSRSCLFGSRLGKPFLFLPNSEDTKKR